ncbi:MAG: peroxidase-related enzyme [Acidobacteria bacterium]|nr:peroxidase-related enzyme [Acidobacteriota bacterium]
MAWIEESELPDVPAIFQAMSLKPEALDVVKRLNEVLSFGNSGLSRVQEEAIATVVSVANRCRYGAMTHAGFLRRHSKNLEMASHFLCDYTKAPLSTTDRRILDFAVQVTQGPSAMTEDNVKQLRDVGLDESQILAVVLIACLSNFMDRLANSLGVDLEPRHRRALENWLTGPAAQQDWLMPPPVRPPAHAPNKAKRGVLADKDSAGGDPPAGPVSPSEEDFADPELDASPAPAKDAPGALEDMFNSGALTNGSVSAPETGEEGPVGVPTSGEEDTYGAEDAADVSDLTGQFASEMESLGGQDDDVEVGPAEQTRGVEEAAPAPASGMEENRLEERGALENTAGEPQQSEVEEPESSTLIEVNTFIGRFVEECCETADGQAATAKELYIAYLRWCDENDQQPLRQRDFGMNLTEMGFLRQRRARGRHWWIGIALTAKNF